MDRVGRKPRKLEHVDKLNASQLARTRLKWILATLSGESTIPEACQALRINESRFHKLRNDWLQAAAGSLEPAPVGRPPKPPSVEAQTIARLEDELEKLKSQLELAKIEAELARVLPTVGRGKKK
jgi:hypothetical protein